MQPESTLFQFKANTPSPVSAGPGKKLFIFSSFYISKGHSKVSQQSFLL